MANGSSGYTVGLPDLQLQIIGVPWTDHAPRLTLRPLAAVVFVDSREPEGDLIQLSAEVSMPALSDVSFTGMSLDDAWLSQFVKWRSEIARILTPDANFRFGSVIGGVCVEFRNVRGDVLVRGALAETHSEWTKEPDEKLQRRLKRKETSCPLSRLEFCFILDPATIAPMQQELSTLLEYAAEARQKCVK